LYKGMNFLKKRGNQADEISQHVDWQVSECDIYMFWLETCDTVVGNIVDIISFDRYLLYLQVALLNEILEVNLYQQLEPATLADQLLFARVVWTVLLNLGA
ncbi:hypothetical protein ACJX0J_033141, partial [Zea mays]